VPTGVALRDAREQLFAAAERVMLREGSSALTSRAVTAEAGVAKGVLHRHFADFDDFLCSLVLDHITRIEQQRQALLVKAGTGTVTGNLATALTELFTPVVLGLVGLVISRDGLRQQLRHVGTARVPLLGEATAMIRDYLAAERNLRRLADYADPASLAPTLAGAAHLLLTDREGVPTPEALGNSVSAVIDSAVRHPDA